jgi:hypothetical protein
VTKRIETVSDSEYVPKLVWDAVAAQWTAADLRIGSPEPVPWPGWLAAADFPTPRYEPSRVVQFRVGGRWRRGRVVSATMSGGDRMQAPGDDLQRLSHVWGHSGEVQYLLQGASGEPYRDVPELRVRNLNDR